MIGSILKNKEEGDYIIFDEWGRIIGVSERVFKRVMVKGALLEFGELINQTTLN